MTSSAPLLLYTREGCHLCDQVILMLREAGLDWREVDIDGGPALAESYGLSIPVVARAGAPGELGFPFGLEELKAFAGGDAAA